MRHPVKIAGRAVGRGCPTFIVAEVSANHLQSLDRAIEIVCQAARSGADAVKIQTFTPETLTLRCESAHFRITGEGPWKGRSLYELYKEAYTPWEWFPTLKEVAETEKVLLFSTPFDPTAIDFLLDHGVAVIKVASFEIVDMPLLAAIGRARLPVILSTGLATLAEISEAVETLLANGTTDLILLQCASSYPASYESMNLKTIPVLARIFGCPVGLSDHSLGMEVAVTAVALGGSVVEKHLTLKRSDGGPDAHFSLEPCEFAQMVRSVRHAEKAIGGVFFGPTEEERPSLVFRRSLFVVEDMKKDEVFSERNVRSIRPGHGLHPRHLADVLGLRAVKDIARGTPLSWRLVGGKGEN